MSTVLPDLAVADPQPRLRVMEPTLAAVVPTTMLLVDYALNDKTMPTPELATLAAGLPADLVDATRAVRAALAHGTVLRAVLLAQLPADHPGHRDWAALRGSIAGWSDGFVHGLIDFGIDANLRYDHPDRPPGRRAAEVGPLAGPSDLVRRHGLEVLASWQLPDPARRAAELLDAADFRARLISLLDVIWDRWLGATWTAQLPGLRAVVQAVPPPPPGCSPTQWIGLVTGLRPDAAYAAAAERARELVMLPGPGLGRSLSLFAEDETTWVLYTPQTGLEPDPETRTGISIGHLARLTPTLTALGDKTRLEVVLTLLDRGPLTMTELADALGVHQSTISRQVTVLRRAGIVTGGEDRRIAVDRSAIRATGETLLAAVD
jgi:DNA-binding transcriptional ArsR family regulator